MREIKFRAWDSEQYEMSYSDPLDDLERAYSWFRELEDRDVKASGNIELMQYTGLKDKNGKEIYEGDIIRALPYPLPIQVEFSGGMFGINTKYGFWSLSSDDIHIIEIIGNIYEN